MIERLPVRELSGAKRANIVHSDWLPDWYVGYGKDESCHFEGSWGDMVRFALNILSCENTKLCVPEHYHPEFEKDCYTDFEYEVSDKDTEEECEDEFIRVYN